LGILCDGEAVCVLFSFKKTDFLDVLMALLIEELFKLDDLVVELVDLPIPGIDLIIQIIRVFNLGS
jgi:hypothetical protein